MRRLPDFTPDVNRPRMSFLGILTVLLVAASVIIILKVRTVWSVLIAMFLFLTAFTMQKLHRSASSRLSVKMSTAGIVWFHPLKGGGEMRWGNVGAISIREDAPGGELALVLTPRNPEEGPSLIAMSNELDSNAGKGRKMLVTLTGEVLRSVSDETVIDRQTRAWISRMGLSPVKAVN